MESKGINQFSHYIGPKWELYSKIRTIVESGRNSIFRSENLYSLMEISIPQKELTPWLADRGELSYCSTLNPWDEDFWMTEEIGNLFTNKSRNILIKVYNTLISRNEKQFYLDYCPIRWTTSNGYSDTFKNFSEALNRFKPEGEAQTVIAGNFAVSIGPIRQYIIDRAKKNNIVIKYPKMERTILWARYDMLRKYDNGLDIIKCYKHMGIKALSFGIPEYPY